VGPLAQKRRKSKTVNPIFPRAHEQWEWDEKGVVRTKCIKGKFVKGGLGRGGGDSKGKKEKSGTTPVPDCWKIWVQAPEIKQLDENYSIKKSDKES